jgi:hypothetical protein
MAISLTTKQIHGNLALIAEQIKNINLISTCCLQTNADKQKNADALIAIANNIDIGIENLCEHYGFKRDILSKELEDYSES